MRVYKRRTEGGLGQLIAMHRVEHIVHLNSISSLDYFPANHSQDFTVQLPRELILDEVDRWTCDLVQSSLPFPPKLQYTYYLCSNVCEESLVGDFVLPILRVIYPSKHTQFIERLNVPVKLGRISAIRLYLLRASGNRGSKVFGTTHCSLKFRKHPVDRENSLCDCTR